MLMDLKMLQKKYNMKIRGILHCGGHIGEERDLYMELDLKPIYWIDGNDKTIDLLKHNVKNVPENYVVNVVLANKPKIVKFNYANNGMSSSILELGTHKTEHPEVLFTGFVERFASTIDILLEDRFIIQCNFINLDLQGAELLVLKGATQFLVETDYIYTEVNERYLYEGGCLISELDSFLTDFGFKRVETSMTKHGWGDALYIKRRLL